MRDHLIGALLIAAFIVAIPRPAGAEAVVPIRGQHVEMVAPLTTSRLRGDQVMAQMEITFGLQNSDAAGQLLSAQRDLKSGSHRVTLTHRQVLDALGPASSRVQEIVLWLRQNGFVVLHADRDAIRFRGDVGKAEQTFGVTILGSADGRYYGNVEDPMIPARFGGVIGSVLGLTNLVGNKQKRVVPDSGFLGGAGNPVGFGVSDMRTFYNVSPILAAGRTGGSIGGASDCLALPEFSDFSPAGVTINPQNPGVTTFDSTFGLPAALLTKFFTDTANVPINGFVKEDMLDIQWAHGMAPGAPIDVYIGDPTLANGQGLFDAVNRVVQDDLCSAIGISIFICGPAANSFYQNTLAPVLMKAWLQGQAVFALTGDVGSANYVLNGSGECEAGTTQGVLELATSPYITAVGGSQFTPVYTGNANVGFAQEQVWNDELGAGGGGISSLFHQPAYQKGVDGIPLRANREIPDVSFGAGAVSGVGGDPGFYFATDAGVLMCCAGGTSLAAPSWAGIGELEAQQEGARVSTIFNKRLYEMGPQGLNVGLRDVTLGNNAFNSVPGIFAGHGYDAASGWGTPDVSKFIINFAAENVLLTGSAASATAGSSAEIFDPSIAKFLLTGSMEIPRYGHTATLLDTGQTLVAGGVSGSAQTAEAEIFDPSTGSFSATGSLNTGRYFHTATLLENGLVLVAGGQQGRGFPQLASAELYNPAQGTFALTGSMNETRSFFTATLLSDGKVLVAGNSGQGGDSAELYDPIAGTFSYTGNMIGGVFSPSTATELLDGRVLLAGGQLDSGDFTKTSQIYTAATGVFTQTGDMVAFREGDTATLLNDGTVLIAGGRDYTSFVDLSSAEIYDPVSETFSATGSMSVPRVSATSSILLNGKVLIAGGCNHTSGGVTYLTTAELYNPKTRKFGLTPAPMNQPRESHAANGTQ